MSHYKFYVLTLAFFLVGCSVTPTIQPRINSLIVAGRYEYAQHLLEDQKNTYGKNNQLLYYLDYGYVLHLSGAYRQSTIAFNKAKSLYETLRPHSVSEHTKALMINDNSISYRGEDYERVFISVFQALNYIMMNQFDDARAEVRNIDFIFKRIQSYVHQNNYDVYQDDPFIRLLSGIMFEWEGGRENINDAVIAYERALSLYDKTDHFGPVSSMVVEHLFKALQKLGFEKKYGQLKKQYPDIAKILTKKSSGADVYIVYYAGFSPIKYQKELAFPVDRGFIVKVAAPVFEKRAQEIYLNDITLVNKKKNEVIETDSLDIQNMSAIVLHYQEWKLKMFLAKSVIRAGGKFMLEKAIEENLRDNYSERGAEVFSYISSVYNIMSEQADLRSWQTLPGGNLFRIF